MTTTAPDTDVFAADWADWHAQKEAGLTDPHGFLAVTALGWLTGEPAGVPGIPGLWSAGAAGPVVTLAEGAELSIDGAPVEGEHAFGVLGLRESVLTHSGDTAVEVAERGGRYVVRLRDPRSPLLRDHDGTPAFPADPRWRTVGRFVPFEAVRPTTVGGAFEGVEHVYDAPGRIEFQLEGRQLALTAFPGHGEGRMMLLFSDETSGHSTYAFRSLQVQPDGDGRVVVDFNRAVNLPCAYTDLATCPLPPAENRLPVAIEAGEQTPTRRGAGRPTVNGAVLDL